MKNQSIDMLNHLATDSNPNVRYSVARNPTTPKSTLAMLTGDENWGVRVAARRNLGVLGDASEIERLALARHSRTPKRMLLQLTRDADYDIRTSAERTLRGEQ